MLSIKGTFQNGVIHPTEPIEGREGQSVIIVFVDDDQTPQASPKENSDWDKLRQLIKDSQVDTGIDDLAHQHDHYLYKTSKREE
jgi:predicted DNA-binding antitoxin AbrB/MazE fold protein